MISFYNSCTLNKNTVGLFSYSNSISQNNKKIIIKGAKMTLNKKYYMYDTNNHTRSQEPTTRNLEIQENLKKQKKKR